MYQKLSNIVLSTSTLSTPALDGGGFGPPNRECYGIGYGITVRYAGLRPVPSPRVRSYEPSVSKKHQPPTPATPPVAFVSTHTAQIPSACYGSSLFRCRRTWGPGCRLCPTSSVPASWPNISSRYEVQSERKPSTHVIMICCIVCGPPMAWFPVTPYDSQCPLMPPYASL